MHALGVMERVSRAGNDLPMCFRTSAAITPPSLTACRVPHLQRLALWSRSKPYGFHVDTKPILRTAVLKVIRRAISLKLLYCRVFPGHAQMNPLCCQGNRSRFWLEEPFTLPYFLYREIAKLVTSTAAYGVVRSTYTRLFRLT